MSTVVFLAKKSQILLFEFVTIISDGACGVHEVSFEFNNRVVIKKYKTRFY